MWQSGAYVLALQWCLTVLGQNLLNISPSLYNPHSPNRPCSNNQKHSPDHVQQHQCSGSEPSWKRECWWVWIGIPVGFMRTVQSWLGSLAAQLVMLQMVCSSSIQVYSCKPTNCTKLTRETSCTWENTTEAQHYRKATCWAWPRWLWDAAKAWNR